MDIQVRLDTSGVQRDFLKLRSDQLPYATSVALNECARQFQVVQTAHNMRAFNVKRASFVARAVKIKPFATKRSLSVTVKIEPPGGVDRADVLSKFEEGGTKTARDGGRLAVPDAGLRKSVIPKSKRPKAFNFRLKGSGPNAQVYEGDKGTFMIRRPDGSGGIFQRIGKGPARSSLRTRRMLAGVRQLYQFTSRVKIDARLEFEDNAEATVKSAWPGAFSKAFNAAVASTPMPRTGLGLMSRVL